MALKCGLIGAASCHNELPHLCLPHAWLYDDGIDVARLWRTTTSIALARHSSSFCSGFLNLDFARRSERTFDKDNLRV